MWGGYSQGDQKKQHSGDGRAADDVEAKQDVQRERQDGKLLGEMLWAVESRV